MNCDCRLIGRRVQTTCKTTSKEESGEIQHVSQCPKTGNTLVVIAFDDGDFTQVNIEDCRAKLS